MHERLSKKLGRSCTTFSKATSFWEGFLKSLPEHVILPAPARAYRQGRYGTAQVTDEGGKDLIASSGIEILPLGQDDIIDAKILDFAAHGHLRRTQGRYANTWYFAATLPYPY